MCICASLTTDQGRVVLLNPSGRGVSDEIASALRRDDELIDLKVSGLRQQVIAGLRPLCDAAYLYM